VGRRPGAGLSIGRIDVNKGYEKSNVRWETQAQQARARRDNVYVEISGELMVLKDAAKRMGINYKTLHKTLRVKGVSFADCLVKYGCRNVGK
jgi:hypothetical protein